VTEPVLIAWADQFGALLRDKVILLIRAVAASGLDPIYHSFSDPVDGDGYRIAYDSGQFLLWNLDDEAETVVVLDIEALGVIR
jgi:hypothetical protein